MLLLTHLRGEIRAATSLYIPVTNLTRSSESYILFLSLQSDASSLDHYSLPKTQLLENGNLSCTPLPEVFTPTSSVEGGKLSFHGHWERKQRALFTCLGNNCSTSRDSWFSHLLCVILTQMPEVQRTGISGLSHVLSLICLSCSYDFWIFRKRQTWTQCKESRHFLSFEMLWDSSSQALVNECRRHMHK